MFQEKVQTCSNRRLSTNKCFSSQFRQSALSADFLRHQIKKVEILKISSDRTGKERSLHTNGSVLIPQNQSRKMAYVP